MRYEDLDEESMIQTLLTSRENRVYNKHEAYEENVETRKT